MNTKRSFGSDNHSGIYPLFLESIRKANDDHAPSYGTDTITSDCIEAIKSEFGSPKADVHFVFNGTAANVLALRACIQRHESILSSDSSHIHIDECGAPEFFAGKVIPLPTKEGKIVIDKIEDFIIRKGDQHYSQPKVISITQPTELGTVYSINEIKKIVSIAKKHSLYVHIDGARLANACYTLKTTFKELTTDLGIDIVSLGGTKNGLAYGEAVVILNPDLQDVFKYIKKQAAQLPSKSRFITSQFLDYIKNKTYLKIATHSCEKAKQLENQLNQLGLKSNYPIESNAVFVQLPKDVIKKVRQNYFFYVWNEKTFECRLMTSWDTTEQDISGLTADIKKHLFDNI